MNKKHNQIAVIGMSGKFPDANNISQFWENICNAKESISSLSDSELVSAGVTKDEFSDENYIRKSAKLDGIDRFDAPFFKVAPIEAELMDPQTRLLLQCAWETLEDAGYATLSPQNVGVFAGSGGMTTNYYSHFVNRNKRFEKTLASPTHLGNDKDYLSTYLSYKLNLTGPSLTIQTACSTSLVAIHQACLSLTNNECDMAMAGGVRIAVPHAQGYQYQQGHIFSKTGQVRTFDKSADGVVFGSGLGLVLLKKLEDAIEDKDHIYAVIRGSAILNDGKEKLSYAASSAKGQIKCVKAALKNADVEANSIGYIEAHGTGTLMGDPEEVKALTAAFKAFGGAEHTCAIGSVKPNVGHLDAASGVTSFIKSVLAVYHNVLPPTLHYRQPNPRIKFDKTPFYVNTSTTKWNNEGKPRIAGVNSLGVGGTNAFIVLEEYSNEEQNTTSLPFDSFIVPLSAKGQNNLLGNVESLLKFIALKQEEQASINLDELAYTLQVGRQSMEQRAAFVVSSIAELQSKLDTYLSEVQSSLDESISEEQAADLNQSYEDYPTLIKQQNWGELANLWSQGFNIDWQQLYVDIKPKKLSLPTYSFSNKRYWIDEDIVDSEDTTTEKENLTIAKLPANKELIERENKQKETHQNESNQELAYSWDEKSYLAKWEERLSNDNKEQNYHKNVLIVCATAPCEFHETILSYYQQNTQVSLTVIQIADETKAVSKEHWLVDSNDPQAFQACLAELKQIDALYFLSLPQGYEGFFSLAEFNKSQQQNEIQLIRLIKYLKQNNKIQEAVDTYILTQDNYSLNQSKNDYRGGGLTGIAYSLAQGNYQFLVRNIDLSSDDLNTSNQRTNLFLQVIKETASNRGEVFKFQSGKVYQKAFIRLDWNESQSQVIKQGGNYVILGGSGTVGKIFTRILMKKYRANVIWLGRSSQESDNIKAMLASYQDLPAVLDYVQTDVTDYASMQNAVTTIKKRFNKIDGGFFAGQVIDYENSIDQTTEETFRNILQVKSHGSWNFYAALAQENLDFLCYFSSGQAYSFSGAAKLLGYASAITFSESLLQSMQTSANFPIGIINWGFWKSTINSIADNTKGVTAENIDALGDEEGFECFEKFLKELQSGRLQQVLCMRVPKQMTSLVNCDSEQNIYLADEKLHDPLNDFSNKISLPTDKIKALIKAHKENNFDQWLLQALFEQLDLLQKNKQITFPISLSGFREQCDILDKYTGWLDESTKMLARNNYIELKDAVIQSWNQSEIKSDPNSWQSQKRNYQQNADYNAMASLASDCFSSLLAILQGNTLATDIIFPNASMEKVENVYANNLISDTYNEIVANAVVTYVQQSQDIDVDKKIRVLEIGAGTGGTSRTIFPKLKPYASAIEEYCYTDLSMAFLFHAEDNYIPENPYVSCKRLDISKDIASQGIKIGSYDLVIATNVLHATDNIKRTLANAKAALARDGFLILNELSELTVFHHLTSGLLDGWWLFEDPELRINNCPGLSPGMWRQVLEQEGFHSCGFPAESTHQAGQQVILSQSNGVIHQSRQTIANKKIAQESSGESTKEQAQIENNQNSLIKSSNSATTKNIQQYVNDAVVECLSSTLKMSGDDIEPQIAFSDYGLDSILGVNFVDQINKQLSISLNTAIIFDHSSVERLSGHISKTRAQEIGTQLSTVDVSDEINGESNTVNNLIAEKTSAEGICLASDLTEIAIIGLSGQFPKAENIDEFWGNLIHGIDGVDELPENYLNPGFYSENKQAGKTRCKWGGVVEHRDCFDPLFFNLSPKEAESMNPHQRLILQESWKSIEDAGYNPRLLSGSRTGIFVGAEPTGYYGETFTGYSDAIIASRLSYILDLNGPAFVVNTGCSSSGVAIHLACESLKSHETDFAIVGGVNACMNQGVQISLSEIEMLSPSGRCATFDKNGDGTIISEGVGVVVLKRLQNAIDSNDNIYGVICGSGMNQDGASNGITAPNGASQEQLILDVYQKYQINPEKISYIEAHGTGTKLGDPIEANALVRAFQHFTDKQNYCALGSAKSHIGHTAAAAGVAGLIKILLSMKHQKFPQLLNFENINPLIELSDSPFYVNTEKSDWNSISEVPRMAALNSFGHSGTNVHLVVREHLSKQNTNINHSVNNETIIPLSARTPEQLRQKVIDLYQFIEVNHESGDKFKETDFIDIAYTLQIGRESMDERLGFLVNSITDLKSKLKAYINNEKNIRHCFQGSVNRNNKEAKIFNQDEDMKEAIEKWIAARKQSKLLALWVKGLNIEWENFYSGEKPQRVSLPSYPFAKQRYWYDGALAGTMGQQNVSSREKTKLHPLVHENISDLTQQLYRSRFTGEEFFLRDHQVRTDDHSAQKVLPGVTYLEMARAAAALALPKENVDIEIRNCVWVQPILVEQATDVMIALLVGEQNQIEFEIFTYDEESTDSQGQRIHCQGQMIFVQSAASKKLNLSELKSHTNIAEFEGNYLYPRFANMGLNYGASHQGVNKINLGERQLVAELNLPKCVISSIDDFVLHPSLLDSSLQATIGLISDLNELPTTPSLPFALDSIKILSNCTPNMFAWVRDSEGSDGNQQLIKLDIDLCDEHGNVCVQLSGFSSRLIKTSVHDESSTNSHITTKEFLAKPVWKNCTLEDSQALKLAYSERHIVICERADIELIRLREATGATECSRVNGIADDLARSYTHIACSYFKLIQKILVAKPQGKCLFQIVIETSGKNEIYAGLMGLLKTAHLENPNFIGQIIITDTKATDVLATQLQNELTRPQDGFVKYSENTRKIRQWQEVEPQNVRANAGLDKGYVFKEDGVYLITGGLGGLGSLFARDILQHTRFAKVILSGRAKLSQSDWGDRKQQILAQLPGKQNQLYYKTVDLEDEKQVCQLISSIEQEHKQLNGIIHSAGMILDNFILKKTEIEFNQVLSPKVTGTCNLDIASKNTQLDFMVLFSSGSSVTGNLGQADYATANGFMDQFAVHRNNQLKTGQRHGFTLAINWPLWKEGGMVVDSASEQQMRESLGMYPMETEVGINALCQHLNMENSQGLVIQGDLNRIRESLYSAPDFAQNALNEVASEASEPVLKIESESLVENTLSYLCKQLSNLLKIPANEIDPQAPMEKYGIDSIMAMSLTNSLEQDFGSLPKTLFFEYQTIEELSDYFIQSFAQKLAQLFDKKQAPEKQVQKVQSEAITVDRSSIARISEGRFKSKLTLDSSPRPVNKTESIAIIGLSGRYPQANNMGEFWQNLQEGKDCISEVPEQRWNWQQHYSEDRDQSGAHFSKWGGFIDGVDEFDPRFFSISPREAHSIDPQERLFLQHAWMAVEDSGFTRDSLQVPDELDLDAQVGVYVGVMYGEYNLSGSLASIANRVSYVLNLHGPSMTLDTMCSSSLTAIHVACQDLKQNITSLAIAGGVNVSIHPNKYQVLSDGQFISSDGHCQSFGEGGDGYIPGEGVGVVVLKRLSEAVNDGHYIYGVIKGSAINHGGKTNGYSVPNPQAQTAAISRAIREAEVEPQDISYIEAHGTGTKLGDPIEIAALSKAFNRFTKETGFCAIGSAKSNIGHCESAAGIAGLSKVLLQMKHKKLVPSLHSKKLNPFIDFDSTAFVVNQSTKEWQTVKREGKQLPRLAGISSFGAGGANAHIIVQEYQPAQVSSLEKNNQESPVIVPLSARTFEQLRQKIIDFKTYIAEQAHLQAEKIEQHELKDIAYTLQLGRDAMEYRVGFIVSSLTELLEKLNAYLDDDADIVDIYQGQVKTNKAGIAIINQDDDMKEAIERWIRRNKLSKILDLWVKGLALDWRKFYPEQKLKWVSLPGYPFAKERYWNDERAGSLPINTNNQAPAIHTLLHSNHSDLTKQLYSTYFNGNENFLRHDRSAENSVLSTAVCLEMARAALEHATTSLKESKILELYNVEWGSVEENKLPKELSIALFARNELQVDFEIFSSREETNKQLEDDIYCQGTSRFIQQPSPPKIDLDKLRKQVSAEEDVQGDDGVYQRNGQILVNCEGKIEDNEPADFILSPSVIDRLLLSANSLVSDSKDESLWLPEKVEFIRIIFACRDNMYAWIRPCIEKNNSKSSQKLDVDLCDEQGNICVQLHGVSYQQANRTTDAEEQSLTAQSANIESSSAPVKTPIDYKLKRKISNGGEGEDKSSENLPMHKKPSGIILMGVDRLSNDISLSRVKPDQIFLPALSTRETLDVSQKSIRLDSLLVQLFDLGDGLYSIEICAAETKNYLSSELIDQLLQGLRFLKEKKSLKALLIFGDTQNFMCGDQNSIDELVRKQLLDELISFPHPCIAVAEGDAVGAGFLFASLCDFFIAGKESSYDFNQHELDIKLSTELAEIFSLRYGREYIQKILNYPSSATDQELLNSSCCYPIVDKSLVENYAMNLAKEIVNKPQQALSLLKGHLSRKVRELVVSLGKATQTTDAVNNDKITNKNIAIKSKYFSISNEEEIAIVNFEETIKKPKSQELFNDIKSFFLSLNHSPYKAVVLTSRHENYFPVNKVSSKLILQVKELIESASLPVVFTVSDKYDANIWLSALSADGVIYEKGASFSATNILKEHDLMQHACAIFSDQFGEQKGKEILFSGKQYPVEKLCKLHPNGHEASGKRVLSEAMKLAASFSRLSMHQLRSYKLIKRKLSQQSFEQFSCAPYFAQKADNQTTKPVVTSPEAIELESKVIEATAYNDGIIVISMQDREAKNMFSKAFIQGMNEVFEHINRTPNYKVVIIQGYASYFASGGTKESLESIQQGTEKFTDDKVYQLPMDCKLPVIAAMQGHGIGAGWALGMFADFVMFSEESHYFSPYMNYGFTPGAGSTLILPEKMGYDLARESLMTAKEYTGAELKRRGLGFPVLTREIMFSTAMDLAQQIARSERKDLIALKQHFNSRFAQNIDKTYQQELEMHQKTFVGQASILEQIEQQFSIENTSSEHIERQESKVALVKNDRNKNVSANKTNSFSSISNKLRELLAQELYLETSEIDEDTRFVDLGLDSITGVTWIRKINESYDTNIEATKVYSYPTLKELSRYLEGIITQSKLSEDSLPVLHREPDISEQPIKSSNNVEGIAVINQKLKKLLAAELYMEEKEIDEDSQFVDLGLDSITGVTWIRKINEHYKTSIEATKVYSYPTISQLAQYVAKETAIETSADDSVTGRANPSQSIKPKRQTLQRLPVEQQRSNVKSSNKRLTSWRADTSHDATSKKMIKQQNSSIAVIGMAGQFPKANNLDEYWQNLITGKNCISKIPDDRWDVDKHYQPGEPVAGKTNSQWMGALQNYDQFDPLFFNISPVEAENMDPQQRLFLQTCWHTIEDAGYSAKSFSGSQCGVFVGCSTGDYQQFSTEKQLSAQGFTGGAASILAARISYFLNLQGPCLSIDTACSSSLVAIANACDSLVAQTSDTALAGGVYVMSSPAMHIKTSQSGMLSPDGRCYSFDNRANGFVPGEAVGAVLLKRLQDAQNDNDNIYGIIEGWGVNQDGKTNGITAPNPQSQTRLQQDIYKKYQINPENIQLIEAHGTGTKLGDPIEVEGLKATFKDNNQQTNYCALGSVKSNIGHCLTAAGVAGVIKVMLALKYKQLPPTTNFEKLNEHIGLKDSPFYINEQLKPWENNSNRQRLAAISSFGFSGTNAHMVVGEYSSMSDKSVAVNLVNQLGGLIILLSAKTDEQLKRKVTDLAEFIKSQTNQIELIELAYTLQVGREPMEQRVGFLVESVDELIIALESFESGKVNGKNSLQGRIEDNKESLRILVQDQDMKETVVEKYLQQNNYFKLLELWVKGLNIDWDSFYGDTKPKRISLPGYPFANERYWNDTNYLIEPKHVTYEKQPSDVDYIHPLVHINTSSFSQQSYASKFNGNEFFLADHQVTMDGGKLKKVLPGVAYLEMIRASIEQASSYQEDGLVLELRNVVWARPVVLENKIQKQVSIGLLPDQEQQINFEIYSQKQSGSNLSHEKRTEMIVHAQGQGVVSQASVPAKLDISRIKNNLELGSVVAGEIYPIFAHRGLNYGRAHQGITKLHLGEGQALAELQLPGGIDNTLGDYWLHPSLMDSALQACIGVGGELSLNTSKASLPFSLESIRIFSPCINKMLAWVRYSQDNFSADKLQKFDIDICDEQGNICIQIVGFSSRILESRKNAQSVTITDDDEKRNLQDTSHDDDFYSQVIESILDDEISAEEAAELE